MASKQNQRITIRLPGKIINAIDMFIEAGEFSCRSDVIRRAVWRLLSDEGDSVMQNLEKINKLNESYNYEEYVKKEYNSK
jgi:Arc/MetJ-type ribon-helix-helix transcriptional regulator